MSRTFEVLERAQQDQELFQVPSVMNAESHTGERAFSNISVLTQSVPMQDEFTREEILRLVQCLFLAADKNEQCAVRRVVFCGIDNADGSNLLCAWVGQRLAEQVQSQVCVVDANVRVSLPSVLLDLPGHDSSLPSEDRDTNLLRRVAQNLWLLPRDPIPTNGSAPALEKVRARIKNLGDEFAYVVISAPPIAAYSDAAILGQLADGVVLVVEANSTRRATARKAKQALEAANVRILGTILNNRTYPIPQRILRLL